MSTEKVSDYNIKKRGRQTVIDKSSGNEAVSGATETTVPAESNLGPVDAAAPGAKKIKRDATNRARKASGEVPVTLEPVRRGQAAARKHKRDAAKKARKAAAARKWEEANALRKAKKWSCGR